MRTKILARGAMRGESDIALQTKGQLGCIVALVATIFASIAGAVVQAAPDLRPYTISDYLKLEETGVAAADPSGHWIVWEQAPPYDELDDYGTGVTGTWQGGNFRLMAVNVATGACAPLFKPLPGTAYLLGEFSPSGQYLTFISVRAGSVRLGIFDFSTMQARELDAAPHLRGIMSQPEAIWTATDRLIFAAFPIGGGPWPLVFRRGAGERLAAAWRKSWQGQVPSVDVAMSHAGRSRTRYTAG